MKRQKNEDFENVFLSWDHDRKERKKRKIFFKTNVLVSSQNHRSKKRRGRHCRGVSPTFLHSGLTRLSFVGPFKAVQRKSKPLGNTHKIPFISDYRVVASTKFLDIWLALQNRRQIQRCRMSLRKQTKKHNVNDTNNNCS
jgi:hypothetical protein